MPNAEEESPLFAALQRTDVIDVAGAEGASNVAVQLRFDSAAAYLQIVDGSGQSREVDYRSAHGALRDLLKAIATIRRRQDALVLRAISHLDQLLARDR